ncbi:MAG: hypothetical protein ABJ327_02920 [Litoreibacter sp.]
MPTIALYGAKSGSGRTTTTAAITLGMLMHGCEVTLVELGTGTNPLARWCAETTQIGDYASELFCCSVETAAELNALKHKIGIDERHFLIIDTSHEVSMMRTHAFELADMVLMPFVGLLDARRGVAEAKTQLPAKTVMNGLALRSEVDLIKATGTALQTILPSLPSDERLCLFSDASRAFAKSFLSEGCLALDEEGSLEARVSELAGDVRGSACGYQRGYLPYSAPPALTQDGCKLELAQW